MALNYIMECKTEPARARIKGLLEVCSVYSFNICHMKGKDMTLSDFLSRIKIDKSDPHKIIPISFDLHDILQYYRKVYSD